MDRLDRLSITLDRLSITLDSYRDMMKRHNKYMLTTLQQLVHDMQTLCELVPSKSSPKQIQHQQCLANHDTVLPKRETTPTLLLPSTRSGNFPLPSSHAQKLYQNRVLLNRVQPQTPCAIPCPPHQQAPHKLLVLAPPSIHLPSRLLPSTTCRTKANLHPPNILDLQPLLTSKWLFFVPQVTRTSAPRTNYTAITIDYLVNMHQCGSSLYIIDIER